MTRLGKKIEIAFGDVKKKLDDELRMGLEKLSKEMKRFHEVRNNFKCSNKIIVYCKKKIMKINWKQGKRVKTLGTRRRHGFAVIFNIHMPLENLQSWK